MNTDTVVIDAYRVGDSYIGKVNFDGDKNGISCIPMIVIIDRSSSMHPNFSVLINRVVPHALHLLNYDLNEKIHLITFDSHTEYYEIKISDMIDMDIEARGRTLMAPSIDKLREILGQHKFENVRIMVISDGDLHDQEETLCRATTISSLLKSNINVSCRGVRFMTSGNANPDTRGISSVLQFNTIGDTVLYNISANNKASYVSEQLASMFSSDGLNNIHVLQSDRHVFMKLPWGDQYNNIHIAHSDNIFWAKNKTDFDDISVNNQKINVVYHEDIDTRNIADIIGGKIEYFITQIKLLKVVNNDTASKEIQNILKYFNDIEASIAHSDDNSESIFGKRIKSRLAYYKNIAKRNNMAFIQKMNELANNNLIHKMNSAQQASYLKTHQYAPNTKNLARRAFKSGLNFAEIARSEVRNMSKHIGELDDVLDDGHYVSFFTQDTTLSCIRALCQTVDDINTIDEMSELDILSMIGIVGISCDSVVGTFPDPMCYRINKLMMGTFASISDLIVHLDNDFKLKNPYNGDEITNIIPIFDDDRIHKFLLQYAPTLLEYSASIGMRRSILNIPLSYQYTVIAGIVSVVKEIDTNKSDINMSILSKLFNTLEICGNGIQSHIYPHIIDQDAEKSYYICNNGVTNMILPMIKMQRDGNINNMHRILSALYSFEVYQIMRKIVNNDNDNNKKLVMANRLVGLDCEKYGATLPPLFERTHTPVFDDTVRIDNELFNELKIKMDNIKYCVLLPLIIKSYVDNNFCQLKTTQPISNKMIEELLHIDFSFDTFLYYCIVQSLIFNTNARRVDKKNNVMLIIDCANRAKADDMVRAHVLRGYHADYMSRIDEQRKKEHILISDILVGEMVNAESIHEFTELFNNGIKKGDVCNKIENNSKLGYSKLRDALLDTSKKVVLRGEKIWILLFGRDINDNIVWNNGNISRISLNDIEKALEHEAYDIWIKLKTIYMKTNIWVYRKDVCGSDFPNRHGHCNSKPSYWAYGYNSLSEFRSNVTNDIWEIYITTHYNCCGVDQLSLQ